MTGWVRTGIAMLALVVATMLVRHVPLRFWRPTLGARQQPPLHLTPRSVDGKDHAPNHALVAARHIERAADRLPYTVKCFPRAIALQWWLQMAHVPGMLVVAARASAASGDALHAWVELDGEFLIGDCERSGYRILYAATVPARAR